MCISAYSSALLYSEHALTGSSIQSNGLISDFYPIAAVVAEYTWLMTLTFMSDDLRLVALPLWIALPYLASLLE